jgi:hypothetical protein
MSCIRRSQAFFDIHNINYFFSITDSPRDNLETKAKQKNRVIALFFTIIFLY